MNGSLKRFINGGILNSDEYGDMVRLLAQNAPMGASRADIDRDYDGIADGNFSPVRSEWEDDDR